MSNDLTTRLRDLADDAHQGEPTPKGSTPDGLWRRGRRHGRRRRVEMVAAAVLAIVALVAGAGLVHTPGSIEPADSSEGLLLPDQLFVPSQWTPGTSDDGPIGPIVAIVGAPRHGSTTGVAGVTSDGDYRFLDLPDAADPASDDSVLALSGDGRWLAYPLVGSVPGGQGAIDGGAVVGMGAYDTVTGRSYRLDLPSEHGIAVADAAWSGGRLWVDYGVYTEATDGSTEASRGVGAVMWEPTSDQRRAFSLDDLPTGSVPSPAPDGFLLTGQNAVRLVRFGAPGTSVLARPGGPILDPALLSPSGDLLAVRSATSRRNVSFSDGPSSVLLAPVGGDEPSAEGDAQTVPRLRTAYRLLGWRDDSHIVVRNDDGAVLSVDVATGARTDLVEPPGVNYLPGFLVADDAWAAPTFDAPEPPYRPDPRLLSAAGVGFALAALGLGYRLWRRRIRVRL